MAGMVRLIGAMDLQVRTLGQTADAMSVVVAGLDAFAADLVTGLSQPEIWADLSTVYDIYPIPVERDTHDRLLGWLVMARSPAAPLAFDDIFI